MTETAFERVIDAFRAEGLAVDERGDRASAQAPGHSPADRSVSISRADGKVLLHSHSDDTADVLEQVGLTVGDLFDEPKASVGAQLLKKPALTAGQQLLRDKRRAEQQQRRAELDAAHADELERELSEAERVAAEMNPGVGTLEWVHNTFRKWLGDDYDLDALDAVLAAAAVDQLDGDPLWLLLISGSGNAKTETAQALVGAGATVTSTVSSPGALLSATAQKERAKDSTGGLLRKLGPQGVLVIKDVTSILSMNKDARAEVLAALREVYDGHWSRNVGSDGGRTLDWHGRLVVVGAVTTAWDKAHAAISSMGDRFVLVRMDSRTGRQKAGRQAISNTGSEVEMRAELAGCVGALLSRGIDTTAITLTDAETDRLLAAADLVTLARTGVEFDYRGDVIDAHAPEMPTRFAKQLAQVVRGARSLGVDCDRALALAVRCARDSMPPLRLEIIDDLAANPGSSTTEVRKRIDKPRNTVDRQLQALHMLGVLRCDEEQQGDMRTVWRYSLADDIDPAALLVPEMLLYPRRHIGKSV